METENDLSQAYSRMLLDSLDRTSTETQERESAGSSIFSIADEALNAFKRLTGVTSLMNFNGRTLLTERAKLLGLSDRGQASANNSCRLLPSADGWIALNLARQEDWGDLRAWLEITETPPDWDAITRIVSVLPGEYLVQRGRLLGLPVSLHDNIKPSGRWFDMIADGLANHRKKKTPCVVDLSSLWAGPLCSHLLLQAGATVIKVESLKRPDSARIGSPVFFDLLNAGKKSVVLDLTNQSDIKRLRQLLSRADIVVESSRPRALLQMGIDAEEITSSVPGLTWLSITGYGRQGPESDWVAFGDDAAVAAGATGNTANGPVFYGDAVSDPLTGMHAAIVAQRSWQSGSGGLYDLSLAGVTAFVMDRVRVAAPEEFWQQCEARKVSGSASQFGSDTHEILRELDTCC